MNEGGVLTDRTAQYASASDTPGDGGFLTATTDRDVVLTDVDQDGWLDVVTTTALMDGSPKWLSHPRVYRNLGEVGGAWQGLVHEAARIPQLFTAGGNPVASRSNAVLAGDVTGDGYPDLYLVDHDSGVGGYSQPFGTDLDDRLLINDGTGFFADETFLRMQSLMYSGNFGTSGQIVDLNLDGVADILRNTTNNPNDVSVAYNDPSSEGQFNIYHVFHNEAPYHVEAGDLNNDGRPDVVVGDDFKDKYRFNMGVDALGRVQWSAATPFDFLTGGDDGFVGNIRIADLDQDGWNDVLVADVDVDVSGGSFRRMHIYHNLGGAPGADDIVLREERESTSSSPGEWIGAVGFEQADLEDTFDVIPFDVNGDGWLDVVTGSFTGTRVYLNQGDGVVCQPDLGFAGPGTAVLSVCGGSLGPGQSAALSLLNAPPAAPAWLVIALATSPTPLFGGTLVPFPPALVLAGATDGSGSLTMPAIAGGGGPATVYVQGVYYDPALAGEFGFSNALEVVFLP